MYGVVYHDKDRVPQLLVVEKNNISIGAISDDERLYAELPPTLGEIVEVHQNEAARIVGLKSVCCLALHHHGAGFTQFYEGVEIILADEPTALVALIMDGVALHSSRVDHTVAEGAEVIEWPDGTCLLAEDYRPEQWTHMSDDLQKQWRSPNELRNMGLL